MYGSFSCSSLVYRNSDKETRTICIVERFDEKLGEVFIRVSENPSDQPIKLYPDLIGPHRLFRYSGYLKPFQNFKHRGISFGNVVPEHMIGPIVLKRSGTSVFGRKPEPVAVQLGIDSDSYVMAALIGIDSSDNETPLVIRYSADYSVPCIKMALGPSVCRMW